MTMLTNTYIFSSQRHPSSTFDILKTASPSSRLRIAARTKDPESRHQRDTTSYRRLWNFIRLSTTKSLRMWRWMSMSTCPTRTPCLPPLLRSQRTPRRHCRRKTTLILNVTTRTHQSQQRQRTRGTTALAPPFRLRLVPSHTRATRGARRLPRGLR